jgi:hypothetical protein
MRKLPVVLATAAAIGGTAAMVLLAFDPRRGSTLPIFVIAMVITFGALSSATRCARQSSSLK